MPLDHFEFAEAIAGAPSQELHDIFKAEILERDPFCFRDDMDTYTQIREHLAEQLQAKSTEVVLVGSAALGYSVAPNKFPKAFHTESDLDFAIISPRLFDQAWSTLLRWGHPIRLRVPALERQWFEARQSNVFWGWMDPSKLKFQSVNRLTLLNELRDLSTRWFDTFQSLGLAFPDSEVARRNTGARLYRSKEHLAQYQVEGLQRLQHALTERDSSGVSQ